MDVKEILAYVCFARLDDSPVLLMSSATDIIELAGAYAPLESKFSPLPGLLNAILPLNLSQKAEKIRYRLSNPTGAHLIVYQVRRVTYGC